MPTPYSEAYREALASVAQDNPKLETLAVTHEDEEPVYIVRDLMPFTAFLETGIEVTFLPGDFGLRMPSKDPQGVPQLAVSMSNGDNVVSAYVERIKHSQKPVSITFRPYLANDTSGPQMDPPLTLQLRDLEVTLFQAQGVAVFARDLKNRKVPVERYTQKRFPSLGR